MCISCVVEKSVKRLRDEAGQYECDETQELLLDKMIEFLLELHGPDYDKGLVAKIRVAAEVQEVSVQEIIDKLYDGVITL
jgi:hypothetical protein